ncbi:MAG: 3-hydroxyacyl-CoA dehydrogenase NAD-binding domain-containing protein [Candidatus Thalassarchaeum sp.]|nr:3-hydroxyacyl-CoA dehydrogenase NAD-binding domain-containing protein [Candidatus Thalassarchaeum sp.]
MKPIETVAIIGAGNMGSGIAQKTAQEQFPVQMGDREQQWVDRGQATIAKLLGEAVERRIFSEAQVEEIKNRVTGVVGVENVAEDTDLVIEAVFEDFDIKTAVFNTLDEACGEETVLASNTSSLSVNALAEATARPDRFVGLHFFYHPAKNRLVEVIPSDSSSEETIARVEQYCKMLGKVVIVCKDRPGFVVNRFFVPWLNEACLLLEEGVGTTAQIDAVARDAFDIGMGPFALMNLTGPPIALHSTNYLAEQLDTPRFTGAQSLNDLVEAGDMWEIDEETECDDAAAKIISERLLGQVFAVCSQIVAEEICSMEDVDRGAKVGLRWMNGPFEIMNAIGIDEAYRMANAYAELAAFDLPPFFSVKAETGHPWEFNFVDVVQTGGVAIVRLNRPEAMNALNETLVAQLGAVLDDLNGDSSVTTIVLEGAGKAFVAGADVKFFVDKIREDSFPDIYEFTADGHVVLNKLENSPKTTIALTTGLALGGGLELALACDYRVGTRRSQFRFPETSIGIYPGLGGTQRTVRICGVEAARWAVLAGNFMDAKTANALGILTHLVEPAEVSGVVDQIAVEGKPANKYPGCPRDSGHPVATFASSFYNDENMAGLLNGSCPDGFDAEDRNVGRQLKSLGRVAPIALRMANELLDGAVKTADDLDAGLALELANLEDIFSTADALEGLSALIEGRRATYTNS